MMTKFSKIESLKLEIIELSERYGFQLKEDGCFGLVNGSERELETMLNLMRQAIKDFPLKPKNGSLEPHE